MSPLPDSSYGLAKNSRNPPSQSRSDLDAVVHEIAVALLGDVGL